MSLLSFGDNKTMRRIKSASVYVDTYKIATATDGEFTINSNGKPMIVFPGGYVGDTQGAITTEINLSGIVPVDTDGALTVLLSALLSRQVVRVKIRPAINGETFTIPRVSLRTFNDGWNNATGTQKFKATGAGGEPYF